MERIFTETVKIYKILEGLAFNLWDFFGSPIDDGLVEFLELPADTTNLELIFGAFIMVALVGAVIKFFTGIF